MAKKESTFLNMVLTLLIVASVAAFTLASVYNLTIEPIEQAREAKKQNAIGLVVPEFNKLETRIFQEAEGNEMLEFSLAYKNDELVGIAVASYTNSGFSGKIKAMVGFYPNGVIYDVVHLEHAETPGLGDKIDKSKSEWSNQFKGFNPKEKTLRVKKDGGEVDGITAATITARAYCDAIERAHKTFMENIDVIISETSSDNNIETEAEETDNDELLNQKEGE